MDKEDYQEKAKALLEDQGTYKALKTDPTGRLKSIMINLLKKIKSEGGIDDILYKKLYPTGAVTPKFYGLPKIHKDGVPLRPIVSSRGSISYEVAKELARIFKPLVSSSPITSKTRGISLNRSNMSNSRQMRPSLHMMYQHCLPQCQ